MKAPVRSWARSRTPRATAQVDRPDAPAFRSDQDYYLWMHWGRLALPLTGACLGAMLHFGAPFDYTPLAAAPAFLAYLFLRFRAWRRRSAGKRFIDYDDADTSW